MKTIWKFALQIQRGPQRVDMPHGADVLTAQMQGDVLMLWALCEPEKLPIGRTFAVYGTGFRVPDACGKYVATVQDGGLVWHVFEDVQL